MAQIQKGTTYSTGDQVTATNLNALADAAILLPGAITDQTAKTVPLAADTVLIHSAADTALRKSTLTQLFANATGIPISTGISGLGTGIATALAINTGTTGAPALLGAAGAFTTLSASGLVTVQTAAGTAAAINLYAGSNATTSKLNIGQIGSIDWDLGVTTTNGWFQIGGLGGTMAQAYTIGRSGTSVLAHTFYTGGASRAEISSTGLAVTGNLSASSALNDFYMTSTTGTNRCNLRFINTGGTYLFGAEDSVGGGFGATAYDGAISIPSGRGFAVVIGGTGVVQRTTSTGIAVTGTLTTSGVTLVNGAAGTSYSYKGLHATGPQFFGYDNVVGNGYGGGVRGYSVAAQGGYVALGTIQNNAWVAGLTIDHLNNVGIGATSPAAKLDVSGHVAFGVGSTAGFNVMLREYTTGTARNWSIRDDGGVDRLRFSRGGSDYWFWDSLKVAGSDNVDVQNWRAVSGFNWTVSSTIRTSINSTGLAVTGTISTGSGVSTDGAVKSFYSGSGPGITLENTSDSSGTFFAAFRKASGASIGSITRVTTTDAVVYNTTSDGRLKENLRDFTDSGRLIDSLKPRVFDWKNSDENGKNVVGFIAQEEHAADPIFAHIGAVSVGDEDPETITKQWQRSDSALIPILVAELKALRQRVAALENS